jgi:hypothetical protein
MKNLNWLLFFGTFFLSNYSFAQEALPNVTAANIGGKIIISWKNNYPQPIATISIQRSFDTLKNYSTIGSVLNPQNSENGFADNKPPYNKMYYRVFVAFEGGKYAFSNIVRPVKQKMVEVSEPSTVKDSTFIYEPNETILYKDSAGIKVLVNKIKIDIGKIQPKANLPEIITPKIITYPSKRIFTAKTNAVVIDLPDGNIKKYSVKFFTDKDEPVFELKNLPGKYLIIEKVNFEHSGWYNFEIYENGILLEKNKFFVPKDTKNNK